MQPFFTRLLAMILALALVVTAETMAMARAAPAPVGETILCTSHGVTAVPVDASGQPTAPPHICPDCLSFFAALDATSPSFDAWSELVPLAHPALARWEAVLRPRPVPSARGPPARL